MLAAPVGAWPVSGGERQGQAGERGVGPQEVADDGGQPGTGEQVRLGVLQGTNLGQQPSDGIDLVRPEVQGG
jgi:hypothetical protein